MMAVDGGGGGGGGVVGGCFVFRIVALDTRLGRPHLLVVSSTAGIKVGTFLG